MPDQEMGCSERSRSLSGNRVSAAAESVGGGLGNAAPAADGLD
jgi:hypothetical protein